MAERLTDKMSLQDILLDLCGRFLLDVPKEEQDLSRVVFQIEQAWWFYLDFYRDAQPSLPNLALRKFASLMFRYTPYLADKVDLSDAAVDEFLKYKQSVPVCGAIILNEPLTKCLLVKGWKSRSTWGFPKGKIDYEEDKYDCAIREVFEETSFDISPWATRSEYIDITVNEQNIRLYMCAGAPEDAVFHPRTRKEISEIRWHSVDELPTEPKQKRGYYMVYPFVGYIRSFIKSRRKGTKRREGKKSASPVVILKNPSRTPSAAGTAQDGRRGLLPTPPQMASDSFAPAILPLPVISTTTRPQKMEKKEKGGNQYRNALSEHVYGNCCAFENFKFDVPAIIAAFNWT